ncbi:MAG TPA: disulfide bond formation protein B [Ramlibacter sp.]|uniref:disulfide bond formation protein B n=1 Tax=Ramlibacter sp. TaxID=1917967 RepID=UPI002BA85B07|nr:disulfide bond formation protein B [Ramlibacter sp.]HVZ43245.1 disulfide bond formation protein B [Ramlibacter sp.]
MIQYWFASAPRRVLATLAAVSVALLAYGAYLQHVVGLEPCPMCIVQRYALILVAISAALGAAFGGRGVLATASGGVLVFSGFGAFVAARQSWLQWHPPEFASCGRDFYGMIENFPLSRAVPMIFRGSGDCVKVDWTFLGLSIANWSFLWFCAIGLAALLLLARRWMALRPAHPARTLPASVPRSRELG